ncbi:MAG: hypothetical protein ACUZ8H_07680 [Candidatus Anammoxibacter sp.]
MIVSESPWQLAESLRLISKNLANGSNIADLDDPVNGISAGTIIKSPSFVALFPGQGSQRMNMGKHLFARYPFISELYERADKAVIDIIPEGLKQFIFTTFIWLMML